VVLPVHTSKKFWVVAAGWLAGCCGWWKEQLSSEKWYKFLSGYIANTHNGHGGMAKTGISIFECSYILIPIPQQAGGQSASRMAVFLTSPVGYL